MRRPTTANRAASSFLRDGETFVEGGKKPAPSDISTTKVGLATSVLLDAELAAMEALMSGLHTVIDQNGITYLNCKVLNYEHRPYQNADGTYGIDCRWTIVAPLPEPVP